MKIHEWHLNYNTGSQEGLLSMEEYVVIHEIKTDDSISRARMNPPTPPSKNTTPTKPKRVDVEGTPTPTKVPLKDHETTPTRHRKMPSDTDTILSDHLSVMSFAFKGSDQVRPIRTKVPPTSSTSLKSARLSSTTTPTLQRKSSSSGTSGPGTGGHAQYSAASAKFAHRLRASEDGPSQANANGTSIRAPSRTRSSLPPAMRSPPPSSSSALSPTNRNTKINGRMTPSQTTSNNIAGKPPWNGGSGAVGVGIGKSNAASSKAPSIAGSVRTPKTSLPPVSSSIKSVQPKSVSTRTGLGSSSSTSASGRLKIAGVDSPSVEGLEVWKSYQGLGETPSKSGTTTPKRKVGLSGRQLGGRI